MPPVLYTADDGVGQVTLNRPEVSNALDSNMLAELGKLVALLRETPPRVLIVTGAGDRAFMAGADIQELSERDARRGFREVRRRQEVFGALASLSCPSIAAINGYALGAGMELALACTLRVAANSARLGFPEVRLGIIPGDGGTQRLAKIVGLGNALDLIVRGRQITAAEAYRMGLVTDVAEPPDLLTVARNIAAEIAQSSPLAVALAKEAVTSGGSLGLEQGLVMEAALHAICCESEEKKRAVSDFLAARRRRGS